MTDTMAAAGAAESNSIASAVAQVAASGAPGADAAAQSPKDTEAALLPPAVVVTAFDGVPEGQVYPRTFEPGETVLGDLAEVALREGWAERKAG